MDENFPVNRYNFSDLVEHIQKLETVPDIVTDSETEIEFYGGNTIPKEDFIRLLAHFNEIDNLAQNDAKQDYEKHRSSVLKVTSLNRHGLRSARTASVWNMSAAI